MRTRTILPVSMMLSPLLADVLLRRAARNDLVQQRLLLAVLAEQATQALDMLAHRRRPRQDDADVGRRHVHALVEDLARHQSRQLARMEGVEDPLPLLRLRLV